MNMNKAQIIEALMDAIRTIELDDRQDIKGCKVMIAENDWEYKRSCVDSNLFIDWVKK